MAKKSPRESSAQAGKICVYIVAHADDWQLFMQPNVYFDMVSPRSKVILIITTAGDAGKADNYWMAREEGAKSSVRYCLAHQSPLTVSNGKRKFFNNSIEYWSCNQVTIYFLRLPDGNLDGTGFASSNFQSLYRLKRSQSSTVSAIDHSATYDWLKFISVIDSITGYESTGIVNRWIHYLNPDPLINPNDHSDHVMTGLAVQKITSINSFQQLVYTGYAVSSHPATLSSTDLFWKAGMFAVYEKAVHDLCGYSTLAENVDLYVKWCCTGPKIEMVPASSDV